MPKSGSGKLNEGDVRQTKKGLECVLCVTYLMHSAARTAQRKRSGTVIAISMPIAKRILGNEVDDFRREVAIFMSSREKQIAA